MKTLDQQVWAQVAKTSSSRQWRHDDWVLVSNASQGIELPYTASMNKRKRTAHPAEKLSSLLNKIGPSPW